jgi:MFS family permease
MRSPERVDAGGGCSPRRATALAVALGVTYMTPVFLAGALSVQIRGELRLDRATFGVAVSAFFLASALLMPVSGRVVDWIGPRASYRTSALLSLVGLLVIGALSRSAVTLGAGLAIAGAASAIGAPASSTIVVRLVPVRSHSVAFGLERSAIPFATLMAGLAVPTIGTVMPWRGVFGLAGAAAAALVLTPLPWVAPALRSRDVVTAVLSRRPLLLAAGAFALVSTSATALSTFFVDFGVSRGLSPGTAGALLALGSGSAIAARLLLGWYAPRSHGMAVVASMMLIGSLGYFLLTPAVPWLVPLGIVLAYAAGWGWTGILSLAVVSAYARTPGEATGIVQAGGAAGGIAGPILVGSLAQQFSYQLAWGVAGVAMVAGCLLLVGEPATRKGRW